MPDREDPRVPNWVGPFLAGSAITAVAISWTGHDHNSDHDASTSYSIQTGHPFMLISVDDALKNLKKGTLKKSVIEYGSTSDSAFTYVFTSTNQSELVLRGVTAGLQRDDLLKKLGQHGATVRSVIEAKTISAAKAHEAPWYTSLIVPAAFVACAWVVSRQLKTSLENELGGGKSGLQKFLERPKERFSDVGGNKTVIAELRALKDEIDNYQKGDERAHLPRGVLMYGDPGVGKTFMARVLCGEAECPMFYMNAGDLTQSSYMGAWTRSVKKLFKEARDLRDKGEKELRAKSGASGKERRAVAIFLDEFDSIGASRDDSENHGEHKRAVNTLLAEMDGVDPSRNAGIIIIAATNNPNSLDTALRRPGRFTLQMHVPLPKTVEERCDILEKIAPKILEARKKKLSGTSALLDLAKATGPISPDHLRGTFERGVELAHRAGSQIVTAADLFEALQQTLFGHVHDNLVNNERHQLVAVHEHGHGLLGVACERMPLIISMRARGESLGRVLVDSHPLLEPLATRADLLRALLIAAGGRAAELTCYGTEGTSGGVTGDFNQMESVGRVILDSGMVTGRYGISAEDASSWELPSAYRDSLLQLCEGAVETAIKVLNVVGRDRLEKIARQSLASGKELVGDEARAFYTQFFLEKEVAAMRNVVVEYLRAPLISKASTENLAATGV